MNKLRWFLCLALISTGRVPAISAAPTQPEPLAPGAAAVDNHASVSSTGWTLAPDDPRFEPTLGSSRNRIRLGLDPADGLTKTEFWISSIAYGAWTSAAIFSGIADLPSNVSFPLSLVGVSGGITGAYLARRHYPNLNGGTLAGVGLGVWTGLLDGVLVGSLGASSTSVKTRNRIALGTGWALSSVGAVGGGWLAHRMGATTGDIGLLASTTFWGAATGLLVDFSVRGQTSGSWQVPLSALVGSIAGTATGVGLISRTDVSRTRSLFVDLGGVSGMLLSLAVVEGSPRLRSWSHGAWGLILGGEVLGLAAGALATMHLDVPLAKTTVPIQFAPGAVPVVHGANGQTSFVPGAMVSGRF